MGSDTFPVFARNGSPISASVGVDPSPQAIAQALESYRLEVARATRLQPPTGRYNCHGLVFASRRAGIPAIGADVDIDEILINDGYRPLANEPPRIGDVVAYREHGEIEHTGFVSRVERSGIAGIFVWSA